MTVLIDYLLLLAFACILASGLYLGFKAIRLI